MTLENNLKSILGSIFITRVISRINVFVLCTGRCHSGVPNCVHHDCRIASSERFCHRILIKPTVDKAQTKLNTTHSSLLQSFLSDIRNQKGNQLLLIGTNYSCFDIAKDLGCCDHLSKRQLTIVISLSFLILVQVRIYVFILCVHSLICLCIC